MPINVTVKQLRCFVAVARDASFTIASNRMHVTQSSLTATIQQFEGTLGLRLFDRTTRRVSLTSEGERFLPVAERLLHDLDISVADVVSAAKCERGQVRVAAAPSVVALVLTPAITRFAAAYPNLRISVMNSGSEAIQRLVRSGEIDLGITNKWADDPDLEFKPLLRDRFGVLCPPGHRFATQRHVTWKQLREETYIGFSTDTGIRAALQKSAELLSPIPPRYEVSSTTSLQALVKAGLGVSVLPALASRLAPLDKLTFRELREPAAEREVALITRAGRTPSPAAQGIIEAIASVLGSGKLPPGVKVTQAPK